MLPIIAIGGYLVGVLGIAVALGARLRIASLEQELAQWQCLYQETPATRSISLSATSVPDAAGSVLASADGSGGEEDEALAREGTDGGAAGATEDSPLPENSERLARTH